MIALLVWASLGAAQAGELRALTLVDGRVIRGEVVDMVGEEMIVKGPQGTERVPVARIVDVSHLDPQTYAALPPLRLMVVPFVSSEPKLIDAAGAVQLQVGQRADQMPAVDLVTAVSPAQLTYLDACGLNTDCALPIGKDRGADVVVAGSIELEADGYQLLLNTTWVASPKARRQVSISLRALGPEAIPSIDSALYTALHLEPPPVVAPPVAVATAPRGASPVSNRVEQLAWMPVPGVPSLARRDYVGLAWSIGMAAPITAGSVYLAGRASQRPGELVGLSLASWVVTSIAVNHAIGLRGPGQPPIGE